MNSGVKVHWSFWVITFAALIWNVLGAINFVVQMNPEMLQHYRESERVIIINRPLWATLGFALAVFLGSLGSLLLVFKKALASVCFMVSLMGVVVAVFHSLVSGAQLSLAELLGIVIMPLILGMFLMGYSKWCAKKKWLN